MAPSWQKRLVVAAGDPSVTRKERSVWMETGRHGLSLKFVLCKKWRLAHSMFPYTGVWHNFKIS